MHKYTNINSFLLRFAAGFFPFEFIQIVLETIWRGVVWRICVCSLKSVHFFCVVCFFYHVCIRFVRLHAFNKLFLARNALIKSISKKIENTLESILLTYRESHVNLGEMCSLNLKSFLFLP